jgi:hypothetical protein
MTPTDQDVAAERAAQALAKRLRPLIPPPLLLDPLAFARAFIAAMRAEHWKCIPPPKPVELARHAGDPPNETYEAVKAAITRKDDHDA